MTGAAPLAQERGALEALARLAAHTTGFSTEAILPEAMRRTLRQLERQGLSAAEAQAAAERADERVVHLLAQAVSVGETFFFRHPEQFEFICRELVPTFDRWAQRPFRAWSAGCATGEETYSLAACLRAVAPAGKSAWVEVLGTDLLERNVTAARAGQFGRWSVRLSGPELYPALVPAGDGAVRVHDEVRALVRFQQHNLLEEPPAPGTFDLVLCRNVLVYFSPASARRALAHLAGALAPGGCILFGPMDLPEPPPGLVRLGPPELQVFQRPLAPRVVTEPTPAPKAVPPVPQPVLQPVPPVVAAPRAPEKPAASEPVALHLRALALIDRGDDAKAAALLDELNARAPDYLPGLTERALLHIRQGEVVQAAQRMRQVLQLAARLPADALIPAPEPLPVHFYTSSAEAFLERQEGF